MKGVIAGRFEENLNEVTIKPKYDLVIVRWGLGYLTDDDVEPFLNQCHP